MLIFKGKYNLLTVCRALFIVPENEGRKSCFYEEIRSFEMKRKKNFAHIKLFFAFLMNLQIGNEFLINSAVKILQPLILLLLLF